MTVPIDGDTIRRVLVAAHAPGDTSLRRIGVVDGMLALHAVVSTLVRAGHLLDERMYPDFEEQPVKAPVYIVAPPRSGTTLMHRLMLLDERFTSFRLYETVFPSIAVCRAIERCIQAAGPLQAPLSRFLSRFDRASFGGWEGVHETGLAAPEEDEALWVLAMASPALLMGLPRFDVLDRVRYVDRQPADVRARLTRYYLESLKRHLYQHPGKTLLMKTVLIPGRFHTVEQAVPDARFVYLLRHPYSIVPSMLSLFTIPWRAHTPELALDGPEVAQLTELCFDYIRSLHQVYLQRCDEGRPFLTVRYDDLVADPRRCVRDVYARLELDWTPELDTRLSAHLAAQQRHVAGQHYTLEKFGLTRERTYEALKDVFEHHGFAR